MDARHYDTLIGNTQSHAALTEAHAQVMAAWRNGEIDFAERNTLFERIARRQAANTPQPTLADYDYLDGDGRGLGCGE